MTSPMTNPNFEVSLSQILKQLNKPEWAPQLLALRDKFITLPASELDYETETLNMLLQLNDDITQDPSLPLTRLVAIRFSTLDCWNYRITVETRPLTYLNPLTDSLERFQEFAKAATVSVSTGSFPPADMIKRWARDQLQ